jgi:hypothetical protein
MPLEQRLERRVIALGAKPCEKLVISQPAGGADVEKPLELPDSVTELLAGHEPSSRAGPIMLHIRERSGGRRHGFFFENGESCVRNDGEGNDASAHPFMAVAVILTQYSARSTLANSKPDFVRLSAVAARF